MTHQCELVELQLQYTLSIRTRTPVSELQQVLGEAYAAVMRHMNEIGAAPSGAPFVAYYNMDMGDLDIEVGFPTNKPLPGKDEVRTGEIPAGWYAVTLHVGPYNEIESAYNALTAWMAEKGYEATGTAYEVYLNDPTHTPPAELQTQVLFPVR